MSTTYIGQFVITCHLLLISDSNESIIELLNGKQQQFLVHDTIHIEP